MLADLVASEENRREHVATDQPYAHLFTVSLDTVRARVTAAATKRKNAE